MARTAAARRYAEAAFELAERDDLFEAWADGLRLAAGVAADERVSRVVDNPASPHAEREALVERMLKDRVAPGVLNMSRLLARRGRFGSLAAVAADFTRLLNRRNGIVEALVTSAAPLTARDSDAIRDRVADMTGSKVDLRAEVDPALIGGITIKVGDQLLDASVRGRLERLRERLLTDSR